NLNNMGRYVRDKFAIIPEAEVKFVYHITDYWSVTLGYNFLFWSEVMRGIEQVNHQLDPRAIFVLGGNPPILNLGQPPIPFVRNSIWAQGITAGIEFKY